MMYSEMMARGAAIDRTADEMRVRVVQAIAPIVDDLTPDQKITLPVVLTELGLSMTGAGYGDIGVAEGAIDDTVQLAMMRSKRLLRGYHRRTK